MTNSKTTKRALLTSALAVLMCVSMLIGTTFAWFTDTASTSVNKIQAGTLDVELEMKVGNEWVSAEGQTLSFVDKNGSSDILWEPGVTFRTTEFRVVNKGNLALKYKFVISGIDGDAKLNEAIEWKYDYIFENGSAASYDLSNLASAETTLKPAGTPLSDYEARGYRIVGHMDEEAGNEYQGLSIEGISITVFATQATVEYDSDSNLYDKNAEYNENAWTGSVGTLPAEVNGEYTITTPDELAALSAAVNAGNSFSGKTFVLAEDLDLNNVAWTPIGQTSHDFKGTFDGQGHTIKNLYIDETDTTVNHSAALFGWLFNGTVKNLTVSNAEVKGYHNVAVIAGYLEMASSVENCTVKDASVTAAHHDGDMCGDKAGALVAFVAPSNTAKVVNCSAEKCEVTAARDAAQLIGYCYPSMNTLTGNTATNVTVTADATGCSHSRAGQVTNAAYGS